MMFIAGAVIGGLMSAIVAYVYLRGKYEKEILESYHRGYQAASDYERTIVLDLIEQLKNGSNVSILEDDFPEGSDD